MAASKYEGAGTVKWLMPDGRVAEMNAAFSEETKDRWLGEGWVPYVEPKIIAIDEPISPEDEELYGPLFQKGNE